MNADVLRIQSELIKRGYLAAGQDDGVFGVITLDAVNHYRATLGKPPLGSKVRNIDIAELLFDLFPDLAKLPSPPLTSITSLNSLRLIWALLPVFTKGTAMTNDQLQGIARTVIAAAIPYAVAKGWIPAGSADLVITAGVALLVAIWSVVSKRKA